MYIQFVMFLASFQKQHDKVSSGKIMISQYSATVVLFYSCFVSSLKSVVNNTLPCLK